MGGDWKSTFWFVYVCKFYNIVFCFLYEYSLPGYIGHSIFFLVLSFCLKVVLYLHHGGFKFCLEFVSRAVTSFYLLNLFSLKHVNFKL